MPERGHFAHQSHPGRIDVAQEPIAERDVPFEEFFDLGDVGVALEFLDELQDDAEAGGGAFLDHFGGAAQEEPAAGAGKASCDGVGEGRGIG